MEIITFCRFCNRNLRDVVHLGDDFPLAGGFMRNPCEIKDEVLYPLSLSLCPSCCLLTCKQVISADVLFKKGYFYYSSRIPFLVKHFSELAETIVSKSVIPNPIVVEIGCNDGVLLKPLKALNCTVIGIDPSQTVLSLLSDPEYEIYNDYISQDIVSKILEKHPDGCDFFVSSNSFAHIHDMKTVMSCMKKLLKPNTGVAIIEVHYAKHVIADLHFDFIYHEHQSYFSVTSFHRIAKLFYLHLIDVEFVPMHGGSIRIYLGQIPSENQPKIDNILEEEKLLHLDDEKTFQIFSERLLNWKKDFNNLITRYRNQGRKLYGYGASGRSNIICAFLGVKLDGIFDDSVSKIGSITPLFHLQIQALEELDASESDVFIILAWPYQKDIEKRIRDYYDGKNPVIVIPLPVITVR